MTYKFRLYYNNVLQYESLVINKQCGGNTAKEGRCNRKIICNCQLCYAHLQIIKNVKISKAKISNGGDKIYAIDRTKPKKAIIFKNGDIILEFKGEDISLEEKERGFEINKGIYIVELCKNLYIDKCAEKKANAIMDTVIINKHFKDNFRRKNSIIIHATEDIFNGDEIIINSSC